MTTFKQKIAEILGGYTSVKSEDKELEEKIDKILSLIIESLPKTKDYKCICGCNFRGACLCKEKRFGFNLYRARVIKMLKG